MMDIAADLKEGFWVVELDLLEKWEMYGLLPDGSTIPDVWTDDERRAMDILRACRESVDAVPDGPIRVGSALCYWWRSSCDRVPILRSPFRPIRIARQVAPPGRGNSLMIDGGRVCTYRLHIPEHLDGRTRTHGDAADPAILPGCPVSNAQQPALLRAAARRAAGSPFGRSWPLQASLERPCLSGQEVPTQATPAWGRTGREWPRC
jgi:hypothetical protein